MACTGPQQSGMHQGGHYEAKLLATGWRWERAAIVVVSSPVGPARHQGEVLSLWLYIWLLLNSADHKISKKSWMWKRGLLWGEGHLIGRRGDNGGVRGYLECIVHMHEVVKAQIYLMKKYWIETFRNKHFIRFQLYALPSTVVKYCTCFILPRVWTTMDSVSTPYIVPSH